MLDTSNPHRGSRLGAGCISHEKGAHARAFRGCTKTGPKTTTTLWLDTSSFFTQARCSCSPPKAGFPSKPALWLDTSLPFTQDRQSVWAPELFLVKNRIREECQKCLGFEYQQPIDSMISTPFGLRSLFGPKNRIREGCQKCIIL